MSLLSAAVQSFARAQHDELLKDELVEIVVIPV